MLFPQTTVYAVFSAETILSSVLFACQVRMTLIRADIKTNCRGSPTESALAKEDAYKGTMEATEGRKCVGIGVWARMATL